MTKFTRQSVSSRFLAVAILFVLAASALDVFAADGTLSFTDQSGRRIVLENPAERVATIPPPAAAMFVMIDGGTQHLAGMHRGSTQILRQGLMGAFFPHYKDVPSNIVGEGFMPNIESLLAIDPDLVFQWDVLGDDIVSPIRKAGLEVAILKGMKDENTARQWIRIMGAAVAKPQKAERLIAWRDQVMARIKAKTDPIPEKDKPRTLYFKRFKTQLKVSGRKSFNNFYIELAGGRNPAARDGSRWNKVVDLEQIFKYDPEVIILNSFESDLGPQDLYDDPLWAEVSAVRNKRVYRVPIGVYYWDTPNHESPLWWMWLSELLHPEIFSWDLREEIHNAYDLIYGRTPDDEQIDKILHVSQNGGSAHYARFYR